MASNRSPGSSSDAGRRTGDQPVDAEHLPALRIVVFETLDPIIRQSRARGRRQGLHVEFRLEGIAAAGPCRPR